MFDNKLSLKSSTNTTKFHRI